MTTHRKRRPWPWWLGLLVLDTATVRMAWHRVQRRRHDRGDPWAGSNLFHDPEEDPAWPDSLRPARPLAPLPAPVPRSDPGLYDRLHQWYRPPDVTWPDIPVYRPVTTLTLMQARAAAGVLAWLVETIRPVPPKLVVDFRMWLVSEGITTLWPASTSPPRWRRSTRLSPTWGS